MVDHHKTQHLQQIHLIQLRKNYDKRLDKNEEVEILGFEFKKY